MNSLYFTRNVNLPFINLDLFWLMIDLDRHIGKVKELFFSFHGPQMLSLCVNSKRVLARSSYIITFLWIKKLF